MTAANLVSYSAQIAVLVLACAALPRVLGLRSPGIQYLFWRALFAICILLPLLQPWRHELREFVAAPSAPALLSAAATPNPAPAHSFIPRLSLTVIGALLLAGVGTRLAWLSAGVLRLRWLRDSATDKADSFAGLQQTIGVVADIRWSGVVRHPVTFGVVQPIVLLPMALRSADDSAQRAVVAHELHHVKRRDWAWVVGEEIVRSIFWFHPAMWWLVSRVQLARETVVDELSILTTNARRAYLDALLTFADDTGLASTPAFSARRHLFHRVMLLSKEGSMSPLRIAAGSCVLVASLGAASWGVVHAFPLSTTVMSVVHDQNSPVNHGTAPQTTAARELPRAPDQYMPPPPPPSRERQAPPPAPPPSAAADVQATELPMPPEFKEALDRLKPAHSGKGAASPPVAKKTVKAAYPDEARAAHITGDVTVEVIVDAAGKVAAVRVIRSVPGLDEAAMDAARQWEFTPARLGGTPTPVLVQLLMTFTLK